MNPASTPAKVGGLFDTISNFLNLGLQGYAAVQAVQGAGATQGQARGLAAIQAATAQVLQALDQLVAAAQQSRSQAPQILQQAEQLVAALSNSQFIYQAKKGDDARVLTDAKAAAQQKVNAIRAIITGGVTTGGGTAPTVATGTLITTDPTTGALVSVPTLASNTPSNSAMQPIDSNLILYGVGALALILIFNRK